LADVVRRPVAAVTVTAVAVTALAAAGCAKEGDVRNDGDRVRVVAGMYPLAYVARAVGGDRVDVVDLTPPGAEPHDAELAPSAVASIERADLVLLIPGFQPEADDAAPVGRTLALEPDGHDPHVWLDPSRLASFATELGERLARLDGDGGYAGRAGSLARELTALDGELHRGLETCRRRHFVTSHEAFGVLARRYELTQIGIAGLDPDADPPPARMAEAARAVRDHGLTTVFFETLVSPKVAETVARETGARTAVLDPVESVRGGDDYPAVMRRNLAALRDALGCT
jgi:zinc transport system substrate-binding protein